MIEGEKVYLRILEEEDIPRTTSWINDEEISEIMGYLPVLSVSNQKDWYNSIKGAKDRFIFAICEKETNEHIGNVGLSNINFIHRHGMFNVFLKQKNTRSKGIGTEVTKLLLSFAFNRVNLNKVYLQTSERFIEANKMYLRLGFNKDGVMRQHYYSNGKYEDKILYSILKEEFVI
ncbi:MAG: GNAT family N-acetyltransferase [Bacteroidia bacterium]